MVKRNYRNVAVPTVLVDDIDHLAQTLTVPSTDGFPPVPFLIGLERGTENEEVVLCTAKTATTFTVERGFDGTDGEPHLANTSVEHTVAAVDYREAGIVRITTAERDAFTGIDLWEGRVIFNTTSLRLDHYRAGEWVPVGTQVGVVSPFAGSVAPPGTFLCNGQAVSRTAFADLFGVIGTSYGVGDGSTTFNVPDMQSRFPVGAGDGRILANSGGEWNHTHSGSVHTHNNPSTATSGNHQHSQGQSDVDGAHAHAQPNTGNSGTHAHTQGRTSDGGAHAHAQGSTGTGGNHAHTQGNTVAAGAHQHGGGGGKDAGGLHTGSADSVAGSTSGESNTTGIAHHHDNIFGLTGSSGNHAHGLSNTNQGGNHTHGLPSTQTTSAHDHNLSNTNQGGNHGHTNPNTHTSGNHRHGNPNTNTSGNHSHGQGSTGSGGGGNTGTANPPYLVLNYIIQA